MHSQEQVGKFIVPTRVQKCHAEMGSRREGDLESERAWTALLESFQLDEVGLHQEVLNQIVIVNVGLFTSIM